MVKALRVTDTLEKDGQEWAAAGRKLLEEAGVTRMNGMYIYIERQQEECHLWLWSHADQDADSRFSLHSFIHPSTHLSIYSFIYSTNVYRRPGALVGFRTTGVDTTDTPCSHVAYILVRLQSDLGQLSLPSLCFKAGMLTPSHRDVVSE